MSRLPVITIALGSALAVGGLMCALKWFNVFAFWGLPYWALVGAALAYPVCELVDVARARA